ncbi:DEAD box ATP-dependent RNA helicase, putative [Perkinsus marinus ATCC 50983]|uniref:ATP-dependent RNA helicase n=1 Tax=Perkinsus marinus (strain ATCC 50983 / TXsc) TaxID=423536 RepID=C5K523_PERM5|nr:DEAD box ATP-dependent RNA helicase, putative [Perkinsus marinus ATCC 50983]EER20445.1 DEAD box ATP-dependent RNA helicase, putative [Perkinsus marinus ATCC 50983]|eukprot:XP_002788649.1 DEAD box ATP-dependent RNA helicase, putative [Perkinsus marinus ATCC 50983]
MQGVIGYEGLFSQYRFDQLDIHPKLLSALRVMGIDTATEIQARAFVPLSMGRDLIINAETGSGKTLSYLLPIFNRIYFLTDAPDEGKVGGGSRRHKAVLPPPTVIICPTYDLCAQVLSMCKTLDSVGRRVQLQSLVKVPQFYPITFTNTTRRKSVPQTPTPGSAAQPFDDTYLGGDSVIHEERPEHLPQATAGLHEHYWSPRIRWGAVDIVVTTPHHFVADLDRCAETGSSANQLHPAAVIFDEADMIFHEMRSLMVMEAGAL